MLDPAVQVLLNDIAAMRANVQGPLLLVIDEQTPVEQLTPLKTTPELTICTNRVDQAAALQQADFTVIADDYQFANHHTQYAAIFHRTSKQKALVHHLINSSAQLLQPNGSLHLFGLKNEGTKTYITKAAKYLGGNKTASKREHGVYSSNISNNTACSGTSNPALDDNDYNTLRPAVSQNGIEFISKPGIYGWQKIDRGSALLASCFSEFIKQFNKPEFTLLDLGCGYGYLSITANPLANMRITATDNSLTAVAACQANFAAHNIKGEVIADDCAESIRAKHDFILCNPPFHQGFDHHNSLTDKFLSNAERLLRPKGSALFVVNDFIGLEQKSSAYFSSCELLTTQDGFKVFRLTH